jgi:hypothetical protein
LAATKTFWVMTQYASVTTEALQLSADDVETGANLQLPTTACLRVEEQEVPPQFVLEQLMFWFHQPQRKSDVLCVHGAGELPCPTHILRCCKGTISIQDLARHRDVLMGLNVKPSRQFTLHKFAATVDTAVLGCSALDTAVKAGRSPGTRRPKPFVQSLVLQPCPEVQASNKRLRAESLSRLQNACSHSDAGAAREWFNAEKIVAEKKEKVLQAGNKGSEREVTLYLVRRRGESPSKDEWVRKSDINSVLYSQWINEARSADDISSLSLASASALDRVLARASMLQHRSLLGSCLEVELFGGVHGHIYGDVIYSDDSDVATAALHAGVLQVNQSATIKVYITGPHWSFAERKRNDIQSNELHYWPGSFTFDESIMRQVVAPKATAGSSSSSTCKHGRRYLCQVCRGKGICLHGRVKSQCKDCGGGSFCQHARVRSRCKDCGGGRICQHGRQRIQCKDCGGSSICQHGRRRSSCKDCKAALAAAAAAAAAP